MHSKLSPSKAGVWVYCPGSVQMEQTYGDDESSPVAEQGTAVHEAAASLLTTGVYITTASNGVTITPEMEQTAEWYAREVSREIAESYTLIEERVSREIAESYTLIEERVSCDKIHPECFGTPDVYWFSAYGQLNIADLKTGYTPVEAYENWQLITYASSLADATSPIRFLILQSAPTPTIREWRTTPDQLQPYWERLRAAAAEALSPNPRTVTGSHCKYCSGRHACSAARSMSLWGYEQALEHRELQGEELSTELAIMYAAQEAIKFRLTGLEAQAIATLQTGGWVPGWSLGHTAGRVKWTVPEADAVLTASLYGVDISKPGALTPLQAQEAGVPKELVSLFSARDGGSIQLEKSNGKKMFEGVV